MTPAYDPRTSTSGTTVRLEACIARLGAGDKTARDDLIAFACERMQGMARRMLKRFPNVRRWDETGDIVQNAAIRLYRTLGNITPRDARGFLGLARKHAGPESYAANHDTNYQRHDGQEWARVDEAFDRAESLDQLARWSRLHESADRLPEDEKELFHLVWYLGANQEEAARMLDCSVRTVKRRWESVKRSLAESLEGEKPG
jgi:RNA polymerase sigma-70 factor (ECF subfamily)